MLPLHAFIACTPAPAPGDEPQPDPLPPDQAELEQLVLEYVDPTRPTPEIGGRPASDRRVLHTGVWIGPSPGAEAPERPLVLLLHGMNGHPDKFDALARDLALAGVVVAAPAFPVSNGRVEGSEIQKVGDLQQQVGDVAFVLDRLLADRGDQDGPLYARFHADRVVGMGHSMGGATLVGRTRFADEPRLAAQVYVSPAMQLEPFLALEGGELDPAGPRTLVAHGLLDVAVPPGFGEDLYERIDAPKWFLGIADAEHSEPVESQAIPPIPERDALQRAVLAVAEAVTSGDDAPVEEILDQLAAEGHTVW